MWKGKITRNDEAWIDQNVKESMTDVTKSAEQIFGVKREGVNMSFEIAVPKGDFTPVEDGIYKSVVTDVIDQGMGKFGKRQFRFTFELADTHIKIRAWTSNSWWWKEPQKSKLFSLCQAAGIVETESKYPDLPKDILGKELKIKIVNNEEGFPRIKEYLPL